MDAGGSEVAADFRRDVINVLEDVCSKFADRKPATIHIADAITQGMASEEKQELDFHNAASYVQMQWCMPRQYGFTLRSIRPFAVPLASLQSLDRGATEMSQKMDWQRMLCYNPQRYTSQNTYSFVVGLTHLERYAFGDRPFGRIRIPLGYTSAHAYLSEPVSCQCPVYRQRIRALTSPPTGRNFGNFLAGAETFIFNLPQRTLEPAESKKIDLFVLLTGKDGLVFDNIADIWRILRVQCDKVNRQVQQNTAHEHTDCLYFDIQRHKASRYAFPLRNKFTEGCCDCVTSLAQDFPNINADCVRCPRRIITATHADRWDQAASDKTEFVSFLMIEYPGYGDSVGEPSKDSFIEHTVKSILEAVRRLRSDVSPELDQRVEIDLRLNFYAFSLGCAVALEAVRCLQHILQTDIACVPSPVATLNSSVQQLMAMPVRPPPAHSAQLTGAVQLTTRAVARLGTVVLLAPFLSTRKMAEEIMRLMPGILPKWVTGGGKMQRAVIDWIIRRDVDWDNAKAADALVDNCIKDLWGVSADLSIAVLHGSSDEVVPSEQSKALVDRILVRKASLLRSVLDAPQVTYCIATDSSHCSLSTHATFLHWLMGTLK